MQDSETYYPLSLQTFNVSGMLSDIKSNFLEFGSQCLQVGSHLSDRDAVSIVATLTGISAFIAHDTWERYSHGKDFGFGLIATSVCVIVTGMVATNAYCFFTDDNQF